MTALKTEQVLVVPTQLLHDCGYFQGFSTESRSYLAVLLDTLNTRYLPRDDMEQDPTFKQLIPYCIFQHTDGHGNLSVFQYTRGKGQGESRLHSKRSIGIGGHISTLDLGDASPYDEGMRRELEEEVIIETQFSQRCVGMINDDSNDVGKVHLGVVHMFEVERPDVTAREDEIIDAGFVPVAELRQQIHHFETWSQICIKSLFGA